MSDKFTPGPWEITNSIDECRCADIEAIDGDLYIRATWGAKSRMKAGELKKHREVLEANARLISAAPDLLAALRDCVAFIERDMPTLASSGPERLAALEAIAKATGVQP